MPTSLSAKKRLRQNIKRRLRNRAIKSALRTQTRKLREAIKEGNINTANEQMIITVKKIDKSCAKGVLHKKTASRMKSRLANALSKLKGEK
ncbi:MAG TPA: 30S ribosomal protein S20 [Candidatus Brocadiia bacterium]|nr:30S ribosomal protein S20 [Planctomycetota bacterium]MBI4007163.1 30S ribosomal protein S20 [Planctomycetota bacterium]MDO8093881.1 30S ribosomal protein S20 [Candidatus Brocadiales bacterium]